MKQLVFTVEGMGCSACSTRIERAVRSLEGIIQADVSLEKKILTIRAQESLSPETVIRAVEDAGFEAALLPR